MAKRLLDVDPLTGMRTYHEYDHLNQKTHISYAFARDMDPVLSALSALRNDDDYSRNGIKQEFWHYAHIPNELILKWRIEGVDVNDPVELRKMVNKPEYAYLKATTKVHA
jgi:hypothetical protein